MELEVNGIVEQEAEVRGIVAESAIGVTKDYVDAGLATKQNTLTSDDKQAIADIAITASNTITNVSTSAAINTSYVDSSKPIEKAVIKNNKLVTYGFLFTLRAKPNNSIQLITGLPRAYASSYVTAFNITKNSALTFGVWTDGALYYWGEGAIDSGDVIRVGGTYICQ